MYIYIYTWTYIEIQFHKNHTLDVHMLELSDQHSGTNGRPLPLVWLPPGTPFLAVKCGEASQLGQRILQLDIHGENEEVQFGNDGFQLISMQKFKNNGQSSQFMVGLTIKI